MPAIAPSHPEPRQGLVAVHDLSFTYAGGVRALDDVTLVVNPGEIVGVVGESGSGKSTLALALAGYTRFKGGISGGSVHFDGTDLLAASEEEVRGLRAAHMGFVFQNPITTLDPTRVVGAQMFDPDGNRLDPARILVLLEQVGMKDPERVIASYPTELSGGMAQRVAIAMAVQHNPRLIIADEPTSALDASVRLQILDLLSSLCRERSMAVVIVSHDLHLVRRYCHNIVVMYAGQVVERGTSEEVLSNPLHPYTAALLRAVPGQERRGERLQTIPGMLEPSFDRRSSCAFAPRCSLARQSCFERQPSLRPFQGRDIACDVINPPDE